MLTNPFFNAPRFIFDLLLFGSPYRLSIAMELPRQLVQAKASPVRRNCCMMFLQSPSVPVLVLCRLSNTS